MASKTSKDRMAWFKFNVGLFSSETIGLSDTHIAIYIKLLVIYWTAGNTLPEIDAKLHRRLGVVDTVGQVVLADVLNEFFPLDIEGNYSHFELDRQLNESKGNSEAQSARARKPRGGRNVATSNASGTDDEDDF